MFSQQISQKINKNYLRTEAKIQEKKIVKFDLRDFGHFEMADWATFAYC